MRGQIVVGYCVVITTLKCESHFSSNFGCTFEYKENVIATALLFDGAIREIKLYSHIFVHLTETADNFAKLGKLTFLMTGQTNHNAVTVFHFSKRIFY